MASTAHQTTYVDVGSRFLRDSIGVGWDDLCSNQWVVLTGDSGSGKSRELQERAETLRARGFASAFVDLKHLKGLPDLAQALPRRERTEFTTWRESDAAHPVRRYFLFLDALDEAEAQGDTLVLLVTRVLDKLPPSHLAALHVVISCKSQHWRARHEVELSNVVDDRTSEPVVVSMRALDVDGLRRFAIARGVEDVEALVGALDAADTWDLYGRPPDAEDLIAFWRQHGSLGDRLDQLRSAAARATVPTGGLSSDRIRDGLAEIAAVLSLTNARDVGLERPAPEGSCLAVNALPSWTQEDLRILFQSPAFDAPGEPVVRFRSIDLQSHFAVMVLRRHIDAGRRRQVERLLLAKMPSGITVPHHLRQLASWLAAEDGAFAAKVADAVPRLLLFCGEPRRLDPVTRSATVRNSLARDDSDWMEHWSEARALARFADPSIEAELIVAISEPGRPERVQHLALTLAAKRPTDALVAAALRSVMEGSNTDSVRTQAAHVVMQAGYVARASLVSATATISVWPPELVTGVLEELYPEFITLERLLAILGAVDPGPRNQMTRLHYGLGRILEDAMPTEQRATAIEGLIALMDVDLNADYRAQRMGRRAWLGGVLAHLVIAILESWNGSVPLSEPLVNALDLLAAFQRELHLIPSDLTRLHGVLDARSDLRRALFWHHLERVPRRQPYIHAAIELQHRLADLHAWSQDDQSLMADLRAESDPWRKFIAFYAWLAQRPGRTSEQIAAAIAGDELLQLRWSRQTNQPMSREASPWHKLDRIEKASRFQEQRASKDERDFLHWWLDHRSRNQDANVADWMIGRYHANAITLGELDFSRLRTDHGDLIADTAEAMFRGAWRVEDVAWPSECQPGSISRAVVAGLIGLRITDWDDPDLTEDDARRALCYSIWESSFPEWVSAIARRFPRAFEVLHDEIGREIRRTDREPRLLSKLPWVDEIVRLPLQRVALEFCRATPAPQNDALEDVVLSLLRTKPNDLGEDADFPRERVATATGERPRAAWWWLWARVSAAEAVDDLWAVASTERLEAVLDLISKPRASRERKVPIDLSSWPLVKLWVLAERLHPRAADPVHEGMFTMGPADFRRETRDALQHAVFGLPATWSNHEALLWLQAQPEMQGAWRKPLERRIAAYEAELALAPHSIAGAREWIERGRLLPRTPNEFFELVTAHLRDIESDCFRSGDDAFPELFTGAGTGKWRHDEPVFTKWLKYELDRRGEDVYRVPRESQLQGQLRLDLEVHAQVSGLAPIVIEAKLAERWKYEDFADALEKVASTYLRDRRRTFGMLLLATSTSTKRWNIEGVSVDIDGVRLTLEQRAAALRPLHGLDRLEILVMRVG